MRLGPYFFFFYCSLPLSDLHSFPTRRSSDLPRNRLRLVWPLALWSPRLLSVTQCRTSSSAGPPVTLRHSSVSQTRSEEHTSELQSRSDLVCRLLLEKKKYKP